MTVARRGSVALLAAILLPWAPTAPAGALAGVGSDEDGRVLRLNTSNGTLGDVSTGGNLGDPMGIAVEASGNFVVADSTFNGGPGAVTRIDAATGAQTIVASGGNLLDPFGIAVEASGAIVVTDTRTGQLIRIDPATGAQSVVFPGDDAFLPFGVAIDGSGNLITVGQLDFEGAVVRVDPSTGVRTVVSTLGVGAFPFGVAVEPSGDIVVTVFDAFAGFGFGTGGSQVLRIDPSTGVRTILSSGGALTDPFGIDVEASGDLIVAVSSLFLFDVPGRTPGLVRVNGSTGAQTLILSGAPLVAPHDVAVEPGGNLAIADAAVLSICGGLFATQTATSGNDVIAGTEGPDVILAGDGNDRVAASGGFDYVCAGPGNDEVRGGGGGGPLFGEEGRDVLRGGARGDSLLGGPGNDSLVGNGGRNFMEGSNGNDRIVGGGADDTAFGGRGHDQMLGNNGSDDLEGNGGADDLNGGRGQDYCIGGAGRDDTEECEPGKRRKPPLEAPWRVGLAGHPLGRRGFPSQLSVRSAL